VRNDQVSSSDSSPARAQWLRVSGGAYMIAAGPRAVWIADSNLNILKQNEKTLF
jgi:hypothetical protein